jgi:hypothetical protein
MSAIVQIFGRRTLLARIRFQRPSPSKANELFAMRQLTVSNRRFGSFASILPCPRCRPLFPTPDIGIIDQRPHSATGGYSDCPIMGSFRDS